MSEKSVFVPPIKCQGIKTKLVPFIIENVHRDDAGLWIEPFVGTGVVALNLAPQRALLSDKNQYIIALYQGIQSGKITSKTVREFLEYHGSILEERGAEYYIEMRDAFNANGDPLYFLFLNRSDFNGMIRFNKSGYFNVPFCQKPNRFAKAYITKICNQVARMAQIMDGKDWRFVCCPWQETFESATENDYIYLDPPYIGRDTSYVGEWPEEEAVLLSEYAHNTPANVCLSMWRENEFRRNEHLYDHWSDFTWYEHNHFYHIGAKESNRHPMIEVLAIKR
ncbi:MAG: Dam family site-specific DNA-(adenine-N6)-methyltransferase [Eubacteriales bacterium]|nr:Dam family site-specific DNA-(adenine-N6)-methyltransferase [Eubacteriales bacterium]MDD4495789.1 Dam family site-specific DNA-(adenine-N6)-methyltransferase [Eubacteriales bacterium]